MKIKSVRIENFRCFKDETVQFDDFTCLIGPNGSGKSTVYCALNVFFRHNKESRTDLNNLTVDDFHHKDTTQPITITVTFNDLSEQAKKDLSDYVRQDKLIVSAVAKYDSGSDRAVVKQYGNRLGFKDFSQFFEMDKEGAKVADLKQTYLKYQEKFSDLPPATTKPAMLEQLRKYESEHPDNCVLLQSEDQFYGISRGVNRLAPHIQWIFIPASKDITEEGEETKNSALGQLLARTVRQKIDFAERIGKLKSDALVEYQEILNEEQSTLDDISESLQKRLRYWSHPKIDAHVLWKQDPEKSIKIDQPWAYIKIGERDFEGELTRFGHGLQRSLMLALLQELNQTEGSDTSTLIMCIEEPEIYQHPPQAKYLAETLYELSLKESQIMICSHSPLFVPSDDFEKIRIVREKGKPSYSYVKQLKYADLADLLKDAGDKPLRESGMLAKLYPTLNPIINEMFFCNILVLVEGIEDLAYINTYLLLTEKMYDFRRYGCHIVPTGGKSNIIKPLAIANLLDIPVLTICDADTDKTKQDEITKHKKNNKVIQSLSGCEDQNEWPSDTIWKDNLIMWKTNLTNKIKEDIGPDWQKYKSKAEIRYDQAGGLNKNPLAIGYALNLAWNEGYKSAILNKVVDAIITFAYNMTKN